jgi:hypothetical protein
VARDADGPRPGRGRRVWHVPAAMAAVGLLAGCASGPATVPGQRQLPAWLFALAGGGVAIPVTTAH